MNHDDAPTLRAALTEFGACVKNRELVPGPDVHELLLAAFREGWKAREALENLDERYTFVQLRAALRSLSLRDEVLAGIERRLKSAAFDCPRPPPPSKEHATYPHMGFRPPVEENP